MKDLPNNDFNVILQKAKKWDALKTEMEEIFYDESNQEALDRLGEVACIHLGFYG